MTNPVTTLMAKEMDRRMFLAFIGSAVLAVLGVSRFLHHLDQASRHPAGRMTGTGYGASPYGR